MVGPTAGPSEGIEHGVASKHIRSLKFPVGVDEIPLVKPWRIEDVRQWLSERLEVPIHLQPWAPHEQTREGPFGSCGGLTIVGTEGIAIRYDSERSPKHQSRQIGHEFGHLCAGHHLRPENMREFPIELFPDLNIGVVLAQMTRDIFTTEDELEAERIGMG